MAKIRHTAPRKTAPLYMALLCLSSIGLGAISGGAFAQSSAANYPTKTVKIVVPLSPGGPTDTFGRMYANFLEKKFNQPFIVENRPGAGQAVGAAYAISQPGDGYTLLAGSNSLVYESLVNKDAQFDSTKDILPYAVFAGSGMFLQINPSLPVKNLKEFIAWVKANPGKLNVGTASRPLAAFEALRDMLKLDWTYVNYKGGTPAQTALLGGEVQAYFGDSKGVQFAKTGRLRILAYSGPQRHPEAPDVPTIAESGIGFPDFNYVLWLGMYTVPAVPMSILTKLNTAMNEMTAEPESKKRFDSMGWVPMPMSIEEARKDTAKTVKQTLEMQAKGLSLR